MKFIVESISKCSGRIGCLNKADKHLQTPLLLLYTKSGSIPHVSKEVLDYIIDTDDTHAIEVSIESTLHMEEALKLYKNGITSFAGMDPKNMLNIITVKDVGEISPSGFHERDFVSIFTRRGKSKVSSKHYMTLMNYAKPDIFHTLCDGDTNLESTQKRIRKSIDRTESFFKECLEEYKLSENLKESMLFAPIEGGYNLIARENTIKFLLQYDNEIMGYFFDGFHNNGITALSIDTDNVKDIVSQCINLLPSEKPKMMLGSYNPLFILEMIKLGVDIFDNSYVYLMTSKNYALTFNFNNVLVNDEKSTFYIDLSNPIYKEDFQPFLQNCNCLACKKHTRAYTNHLIITKELLAPVLLMIHNTHHYLEFFKKIRQSIVDDTLSDLIVLIQSQIKIDEDKSDKKDDSIGNYENDKHNIK